MGTVVKIDWRYWPGAPKKVCKINIPYKRKIDNQLVHRLHDFIRKSVENTSKLDLDEVVVGLSGGLDSALVALLCRQALGKNKVTAVTVDLGFESHRKQADFAKKITKTLDINHKVIRAYKLFKDYDALLKERGPFTEIDIITRAIHDSVFQFADSRLAAVPSTVDKSENLIGRHMEYFYGHFAPLIDLYKTEVNDVARLLKIPNEVIEQEPGCAEAWRDREVFGVSYDVLDPIIHLIVKKKMSAEQLARKYDIDLAWLKKIEYRLKNQKWRMQTQELLL